MAGLSGRDAPGGEGRLTRAAALLALAAAVAAAGCAQFETASERDPGADFPGRTTFAWIPFEDLPPPDPGVDDRATATWLRAAFGAELGLRGWRETARDPDLLVSFRAGVTDRRGQTIWGSGFGRRVPGAGSPVEGGAFRDAVLVFDAREPKTGRRLWRSSARGVLFTGPERERQLQEMVRAALGEFPPAERR